MKKAISIFLVMSIFACQEKLPKPTETGSYTFGCKINGKSWIPDGGKGFMAQKPIEGGFYNNVINGKIVIFIFVINKKGEEIEIYLEDEKVGVYLLNKSTGTIPNQLSPLNYATLLVNKSRYVTNTVNTGKVTITKSDRLNTGILAGTFEFKIKTNDTTYEITNGRFDVNVKNL
jgi:Family of unknown function (DUF6252)